MEALIPQLIAAIPTAALPLVFVIVACWFIYWKIQSQRKETKKERDEAHDNLVTRVTLLEREIEEIKQLDLATKLAQIQTDLNWIKEKLK
jgi:flagellar biosynthesis component FlhA